MRLIKENHSLRHSQICLRHMTVFLGIKVDTKLNFNEHLKHVICEASQKLTRSYESHLI